MARTKYTPEFLKRPEVISRFWAKVDKVSHPNGCWLWIGSRSKKSGYGMFSCSDKPRPAHRVSYEITYGPVEEGEIRMCVCHRCDNPQCVNPAHLFLGTYRENAQDMINKGRGRHLRGENNKASKWTEEMVREIRRRYAEGGISMARLSQEFGPEKSAIHGMIHRNTWKHVE